MRDDNKMMILMSTKDDARKQRNKWMGTQEAT